MIFYFWKFRNTLFLMKAYISLIYEHTMNTLVDDQIIYAFIDFKTVILDVIMVKSLKEGRKIHEGQSNS